MEAKTSRQDLRTRSRHPRLPYPWQQEYPFHVLLWRNQRVYYFTFSKPTENSAQRIKDLIARFRTREAGTKCRTNRASAPYGFIADDGKTAYELKNSLRFTRTPNVIFSLLTASAMIPGRPVPPAASTTATSVPATTGRNGKKRAARQPPHRQAPGRLRSWRLDPRPDSGERERAWFGLAFYRRHPRSAGSDPGADPQKGTDDLTDYTPPPKKYCPA
ncbi:hypothetical protein P4200_28955 [Pseudomonas aeruginosa]|nr:hypothetical protein [Pseudomonas aeruginosa]